MKIVILQDDFYPEGKGGAAVVALNLAREYSRLGNKVIVITATQEKNKHLREETDVHFSIYRIYSNYHHRWQAYRSLKNQQVLGPLEDLFKKIKPDVVHAHNIHRHLSYHSLKLAKDSGAKVFLTSHDVMLFSYGKIYPQLDGSFKFQSSFFRDLAEYRFRFNPFRNLIIRQYLKKVDKIFAVSFVLEEALHQNQILNTEVIYNGIDADSWKITEETLTRFKAKYSIKDKVILFGGRLGSGKGGKELIRALGLVKNRVPNFKLLIVGKEDTYTQQLLREAENVGIRDRVQFLGWLEGDDVKAAYWFSDLVTFPSICFETFGLVNIEAMASKKPVIGTCFGGSAEIIKDGVTGYIIDPRDTNLFSEKIHDLLSDDYKARQFGLAGFDRVREIFDLRSQAQKYLSFFRN